MLKVMFKLRQFFIDRLAIALDNVKSHHEASVLGCSASTGKPMRPPAALLSILKISTG